MAISPPEGGDEQDGTDFLSTQVVFGNGSRSAVGLDVLATNALKDACGLTNPRQATHAEIVAIFRAAM